MSVAAVRCCGRGADPNGDAVATLWRCCGDGDTVVANRRGDTVPRTILPAVLSALHNQQIGLFSGERTGKEAVATIGIGVLLPG